MVAAGSLALSVALCVLWVRSFSRCDYVAYGTRFQEGLGQTVGTLYSEGGVVCYFHQTYQPPDPEGEFAEFVVFAKDLGFTSGFRAGSGEPGALDGIANLKRLFAAEGFDRFGFAHLSTKRWNPTGNPFGWFRTRVVSVPQAALVLLFAALPVWRVAVAARRRLRAAAGRCRRCGYDLRATPDRCPECGTTTHIEINGNLFNSETKREQAPGS